MSFETTINDADKGYSAVVSDEGELLINQSQAPAVNGPNKIRPFVANVTVNGDGVTSDLTVNGSTTPVDCFVGAVNDGDLYLTTANVVIADAGSVQLNRFGSAAALTNGLDLFYATQEQRYVLATGVSTNFDLLRISTLSKPTGGKADGFQLANLNSSNNDGYNPILDLTRISPIGIRLKKSSTDKLGLRVNDNITGVATFNVVMLGFVRLS